MGSQFPGAVDRIYRAFDSSEKPGRTSRRYPPQTFPSRRVGCSPQQVAHDVGTKLPGVGGRRTDLGSLVSLLSLTNDGPETSRSSILRSRVVGEHGRGGTRLRRGDRFSRMRLDQTARAIESSKEHGRTYGYPHDRDERLGERSITSASGMFRTPPASGSLPARRLHPHSVWGWLEASPGLHSGSGPWDWRATRSHRGGERLQP